MDNNGFITKYGFFSTIVVTVIGVGIFSYPRGVTELAGNSGWLVTLIGGLISFILLYIIYKVVEVNNFKDFPHILEDNFGRLIGGVVSVIFVSYTILSISAGMRIFAEVIKMYLLEKTPIEFILITIILSGIYLVRGKITNLVRFNELCFWIMFTPLIFMLMLTLRDTDVTNLLPLLDKDPLGYIKAINYTVFSFGGFEIAFLILPYMKNKKNIPGAAVSSMGFITIIYAVITIFCIIVLSKSQTSILLWPTITMIKNINVQGGFVERWESIAMALWVLFYFTTFANIFFFSSDLIKNTFKLEDVKISSLLIAPFIYIVSLYPENIAEVYNMMNIYSPIFSAISLVLIPIALLVINAIRKRGETKNEFQKDK